MRRSAFITRGGARHARRKLAGVRRPPSPSRGAKALRSAAKAKGSRR